MRPQEIEKITLTKGEQRITGDNVAKIANGLNISPSAIYHAIRNNRPVLGWEIEAIKKDYQFDKTLIEENK